MFFPFEFNLAGNLTSDTIKCRVFLAQLAQFKYHVTTRDSPLPGGLDNITCGT
jgi:hypothetical protein